MRVTLYMMDGKRKEIVPDEIIGIQNKPNGTLHLSCLFVHRVAGYDDVREIKVESNIKLADVE